MSGLRLVLLLAVGLSLGVAYPSADSWAATTKRKAAVIASQCRYTCPKGEFVCTDDDNLPNGCHVYHCCTGLPGNSCCP
jgi:hypothetical protein